MKISALSLLAAILFLSFSGCSFSNDEDNVDPNSGFIHNDSLFRTQYAIKKNWTGGIEIAFANMTPSGAFSGQVHMVQFLLDTLVDQHTYIYMPSDSSAFDKNNNFGMALLYKNVTYKDGQEVTGTGEVLSKPTGGSLTFVQGDGYQSFTYTLEFGERRITGVYKGGVEIIN